VARNQEPGVRLHVRVEVLVVEPTRCVQIG
jgi:hypothetical protein